MTTAYSKSFVRVEDSYSLLALNVFLETFRNIEAYFMHEGSVEERIEGRYSIRWIRKMEGNFRLLAVASNMSLEEFHLLCLKKINDIKKEAYAKKKLGQ